METKAKTQAVRIREDDYNLLKRISKKTGISLTNLMTFAIKQYALALGKNTHGGTHNG